jgi:hypothetical protein
LLKAVLMKIFFSNVLKKVFWKDKLSLFLLAAGFFINLACFLALWWQIKPDDTGVVLHYNVYFGIDVISFDLENFYFQVFLGPLGAAIIWLMNFILGLVLYFQVVSDQKKESLSEKKERAKSKDIFLDYLDAKMLSAYLLWTGSLVVQLALVVYVIGIIMVNK